MLCASFLYLLDVYTQSNFWGLSVLLLFFSVLRDFYNYKLVETNDESNKRLSVNQDQEEEEITQLGENIIVNNIGLPVVVVVTKVAIFVSLKA